MILIAYDPGKMTGLFVWSEGKVILQDQRPAYETLVWLEEVIPLYAPWGLTLVGERFRIGPQTLTKAKDAYEAIGMHVTIGYWCTKYGVPLKMQNPAEAKAFSTDLKLKALGWHKPTPGGHANDAARHALVWLVDQHRIDVRDLC